MEGWHADDLCRRRQLHPPAERSALRRGGRAYARLHGAVGVAAAGVRDIRRRHLSRELSRPRRPARDLHHADDGDAGRDRAGLDHDVSSAARRSQLSAVACRPAAAALGISSRNRDPFAGAGRDLAVDAAGDADRARRHRGDSDRALRERADRRREPLADVPLHHLAADHAVPVHRGHDPHDRCGEEFRHHLRHHPGRARLGLRDGQSLSLQRRLHLLRPRLWIGDRRDVVPADRGAGGAAVALAATRAVDGDRGRGMSLRWVLGRIGLWFSIFLIVSPAILFFVWMLSLSVKFEVDNAAYPPVFIPEHFAWQNYSDVLASNRFLTYFKNSLLVTGTATGLAMLVGVPAGYGIARMAARKSAVVILIARITPGLSYLIPLFLLFQWLGLLGTLWPQIIIHLVVTVPIVIWIMIGYFETTPMELEESALIDGATRWQVFRYVALPIARPGIAVAFILAVIFSWNNFVFGIVLAGRETRTLPVAVYNMISFDQLSWGPLAAAALIVTLPVLLLTVFAQRQIVAGLTAGAVKGG